VGSLIYMGTLGSPFFFDDVPSIVEARELETLWPLTRAFDAPQGSGQSGRPLVALSLALNYAVGERAVLGYHLVNIAFHVLASLALFGVVRRAALTSLGSERQHATGFGFAVALLWVVHPLHTDALNHVVYRNETMMALFYLLTLYCALRSFDGARAWRAAAVVGCLAAMASKEVAVSLPLAVLACDAFFGAGSVRAALRARPAWYASLAACWLALTLFIASGDRGVSVSVAGSEMLGPLDYFRTQLKAVPLYVRLSLVPYPLIFDYFDGQAVRAWGPVLLPGVVLATLLGMSLHALWKGRVAGLLGVAVAALLAPTSSFLPLTGELIAEHRMVLPLAPLLMMVVLLTHRLLARLGDKRRVLAPLLLLLAGSALAATTVARNADYRSQESLWRDTVEKRPSNARAWNQLGLALRDEGQPLEAEAAFRHSIELEARDGRAQFNLAGLLFQRGELAGAAELYGASLERRSGDPITHYNYGSALLLSKRTAEALRQYELALELQPGWELPASRLAWQRATNPDPALRDGQQALRLAQDLVKRHGPKPRSLDILAAAYAELGRFEEARVTLQRALAGARSAGKPALVAELEQRAALYATDASYRKP
jgi:tetratricopeptide (TPR) repeat protein